MPWCPEDGDEDGDGTSCNQAWEGASKTKAATSLENYCSQIELHSQDPFFRSDDQDGRHFSSVFKRFTQNRDPFLVEDEVLNIDNVK